ncbi:MAG: polyprenyl synthetase family protein [Myxococcales bacterium]|nr:polyprenyl synthetase family protein [Myxococcales bacterium]
MNLDAARVTPMHEPPANKALQFFERTALPDDAEKVPARLWETALLDPGRSFLARSGKAFRACLVELGWALGGGIGPCPDALTQVVELLHAGSLIVDDIEDASTMRRGGPALHVSHGMPRALNLGNMLYFQALALLPHASVEPSVVLSLQTRAIDTLLRCHQGQALDLTARVDQLAMAEVGNVVRATTRLKTGALMSFAAASGALAAGASPVRVQAIAAFGELLGCALQMLDDLSGIVNPERADKGEEDLREGRPTWCWAWLAEEGGDEVSFARLVHRLRDVRAGGDAAALAGALRARVEVHGRALTSAHLAMSFSGLRRAVGDHPALSVARAEIERLAASYL